MTISAVRIVLVAPAGPLNVGSIARVMKNFGLSQLVLVNPQCDPLGAEALQMAVHAKDVLEAAQRVETIPEALNGCRYAIATTARQRGFDAPLESPAIALPTLLAEAQPNSPAALIFGPEDRGLSNEELTYAQRFIKIPTDATYSALNLAQAVAVCCYELYRAATMPEPSSSTTADKAASSNALRTAPSQIAPLRTEQLSAKQSAKQTEPCSQSQASDSRLLSPLSQESGQGNSQEEGAEEKGAEEKDAQDEGQTKAQLNELEGYYQHLERVLLKVEYLYSHTAASRMRKFRHLLNRAEPTSQEVAMLRGILRQTEWALSHSGSLHSPSPESNAASSQSLSDQPLSD